MRFSSVANRCNSSECNHAWFSQIGLGFLLASSVTSLGAALATPVDPPPPPVNPASQTSGTGGGDASEGFYVGPAPKETADPATRRPVDPEAPHIVFAHNEQARDHITGGDTVEFRFEARNTGRRPLHILSVQPGCGCTVASFDPVLLPGKKGTVRAVLHTEPLWESVTKSLLVLTDDPSNPALTLRLIANVVPAYRIAPRPVMVIPYSNGAPIQQLFTVQSNRSEPLELGAPATSGPVTASVTAIPGRTDLYEIRVTLSPPASLGDALGQVLINTGSFHFPPVQLTMVALGQAGVSCTPATAELHPVREGEPARGSVSVFCRKGPFRITHIQATDPAMVVTCDTLAVSQNWHTLQLSYAAGSANRQGECTVRTDLGEAITLHIPFHVAALPASGPPLPPPALHRSLPLH